LAGFIGIPDKIFLAFFCLKKVASIISYGILLIDGVFFGMKEKKLTGLSVFLPPTL
jgi:hypothetical protein